jgi:hypothetical protein
LSLFDDFHFTHFANDIGSARRRDTQPVRKARPRGFENLYHLCRRLLLQKQDDQEAFALMTAAKNIRETLECATINDCDVRRSPEGRCIWARRTANDHR